MKRKSIGAISVLVFLAVLTLNAQTPGKIPIFDQPNTGACNAAAGNDCIDSIITQAGGNIGVGTNTPAAKLDIVGGNLNLEDSTATSGNILKAGALFLSNFGINNTFMGRNAGNSMVSGDSNTGIGVNALANSTTGRFNTATGVDALGGGTIGSFNTATGVSALRGNFEGSSNTATGWAALITNDEATATRPTASVHLKTTPQASKTRQLESGHSMTTT